MELLWRVCSAGIQFCSGFVFANKVRMYRCLHNVRAHAYSNILSEVPLRQTEDGQYRPKHVAVHYIVIKYTSCDTVVFDYVPFSKFHTHNGDDTLPANTLCMRTSVCPSSWNYSVSTGRTFVK